MSYVFEDTPASINLPAIPLTELYVQALSPEAYEAATSSAASGFQKWLSSLGPVKTGDIYTTRSLGSTTAGNSPVKSLRYLIRATIPTFHGTADDTTSIFISPNDHDPTSRVPSCQEVDIDNETYEIDENFMESGMLFQTESRYSPRQRAFAVAALSSPINEFEDDRTIYMRTEDLASCGLLDGDWAVARLKGGSFCRLCRVQAIDTKVYEDNTVYASPLTRNNLLRESRNAQLDFYPTPFGTGLSIIPTARTATVARIASPIAVDKTYQPLFLQKLHDYFKKRPRLIQQGDIIAVALDTDDIRWISATDGIMESLTTTDVVTVDNAGPHMPAYQNGASYFIITNVECDAITLGSHYEDQYAGITTGEWGCWVNPSSTRIVQTGIEHARVPFIESYFALEDVMAPSQSVLADRLKELISAALTSNASAYDLQLSVILKGTSGVGKMSTISHVARQLGLHILELNCFDVVGENDTHTEGFLRARFEKASLCSPCILVLRHIDALSQTTQNSETGKALTFGDILLECMSTLRQSWSLTGFPVVVVATTDRPDDTDARIMSCFKHEISFDAPEEDERHEILQTLTHNTSLAPDISLRDFSVQTAALVASDLVDLVSRGKHNYMKRALGQSGCDPASLRRAGIVLSANDLDTALNKARATYSESIGAPKIPNVSWDDVGGLASVKADILDTIQLPLQHPELFSQGLKKRSGILLYGPPGTGKTLLAKAVATSCSLNFFSVKGPELLNMYIGESEANVRRVFQRARDAKPCVIFFDELDSVAPKRGAHGDSGGVMDRIVSQLLAELDGVAAGEAGAEVFVIGATNRPDLLDPALLRPGRFDRMLYLGVSQTHEAQLNILQALTRKFKLHPELSLQRIAEACPFHYTGADFYALCSDALLKAMSRKAEELEEKIAIINASPADPRHPYPITPQYYLAEMASLEDVEVLVSQADFESALQSLIPSVSQAEMEHYARVQKQFSKETINST